MRLRSCIYKYEFIRSFYWKIRSSIRDLIVNVITRYIIKNPEQFNLLLQSSLGINNYGGLEATGELYVLENVLENKLGRFPQTIIDVGAHEGQYALTVRKYFPEAQIYAFEPNPDIYKKSITRLAQNKINYLEIGLSSHPGEVKLYNSRSRSSEISSIYDKIFINDSETDLNTYDIQVSTLDHFCRENGIKEIDFLKIDVEGHEIEVLRGGEKLIRDKVINIIQFEFNEFNIYSRTFLYDFYELLKNYQFYRLSKKGLIPLNAYSPKNEVFLYQNILAILQ